MFVIFLSASYLRCQDQDKHKPGSSAWDRTLHLRMPIVIDITNFLVPLGISKGRRESVDFCDMAFTS